MSPGMLGLSLSSSSSSSNSTNSSSTNGVNTTRSASKNIKCPHCNWHYKYTETLANHIKDKHPNAAAQAANSGDQASAFVTATCAAVHACQEGLNASSQCRHCLHGLPHPRLSRGESYPCGYKPYRCDVCDYSTTTKGNLAIHKQSDKHLNNAARERGRGSGLEASPTQPPPPSAPAPQPTSRSAAALVLATMAPTFDPRGGSPWDLANGHAAAAALMDTGPPPQGTSAPGSPEELNEAQSEGDGGLLQCAVCHGFEADSLELMSQHMDSAQQVTAEVELDSVVQTGDKCWTCRVCPYQSTLKANFQLHCKTDKHLQRLRYLAHLSLSNGGGFGGGEGEAAFAKMESVASSGCGGLCPVLVRCRLCGAVVNSIEKMRLHLSQASHEAAQHANRQIEEMLAALPPAERRLYSCVTCSWTSNAKLGLLRHVSSHDHAHTATLLQVTGAGGGHPGKAVRTMLTAPFPCL